MENFKKILEVLNDLIRINKDREAGYAKASRELTPAEHNLRGIFERKAQESRNNVLQLEHKAEEIKQNIEDDEMSGLVSDTAGFSGRIYKLWKEVRHLFNSDDKPSNLASSCMEGEITAGKCYENALKEYDLPPDILKMLAEQKQTLDASQQEIKGYISR